jgi:TonB-linked SusC/RagA family outer membrane protein
MKLYLNRLTGFFRCFVIVCLLATALIQSAKAQNASVRVTGTVTGVSGEPIPGVNIIEKSTKKGTNTNAEGQFSLEVSSGATLLFSFVGYVTQEVTVGNQTNLTIQLLEDNTQLAEVVAIGYQTLRKGDLTGAVADVKAKELNLTTPTLGQALVGKLAGVQISQVSGAPYVSTKIRVRGIGSINASSEPLYVIDGFPAGNDVFINPNDIESINVLKDAASAAIYGSRASGGVVLITTKRGKDGKGHLEYEFQYGINQLSKKVKLLNGDQFTQLLIDARNNTYRDLMLNAGKSFTDANFSDLNATRVANVGNASSVQIPTELYDFATQTMIKPKYNTDWQDELYQNAPMLRHNLTFSGGNENVKYLISGGYQNQDGIIVFTKQERVNFRANVDAKLNPKVTVGSSIFITSNNNREVQEGRFNQGPILGALIYPPIFRAYDDNGNLLKNEVAAQQPAYGYQTIENPVALAKETNITRKGLRGTYNGTISYELIKNLIFKANIGLQTYNEKYEYYLPTSLSNGNNPPYSAASIAAANAVAQTNNTRNLLGEFTGVYTKQFGLHNFNLLAGYTAQKINSDIISVTAKGFQNDLIQEITAKGADATNFALNSGTGKSEQTLLSYLARIQYNFGDRYYLTAAYRRDGSSRFGPENRWGNFPSVSAGWKVSNEEFYPASLAQLLDLKLRASWGLVGNYNIGDYNYSQTMNSPGGVVFGNGTVATAIWAGGIKDQKIGWESTSQFNFGLDAGLFKNRISLTANYYVSDSYNLLFNKPQSAISGTSSVLTNLRDSKIRNQGLELQADARVIAEGDFKLSLSGNISLNRGKVLNMGGANDIPTAGAERSYITHYTQQGQPVGMFYGFKVIGMVRESDMENLAIDNANYNAATQSFPAGYVLKGPARSAASTNPLKPGDLIFEDVNKDGVVNDKDKRVIGSPYPKFIYGFSLNASYKFLDLAASFNGSYGNQVLDGQDYYLYNMEASGNQYASVTERYRSEAEPGNGQVYRASRGGTQSNSTRLSTFYLQNGSYFRCTNLTLGFNLPESLVSRAKIGGIRIYANVNNAFTISKYKGYNPEVDYNNGSNLAPGVDYGKYPLARGYNLGIKVTL